MMKKHVWLLTMAIVSALLVVPPASANHGLSGELVTDLGILSAQLSYRSGDFDAQTWEFTWFLEGVPILTCDGFGSVEIGFTSTELCGIPWRTGPTGDSHSFPHCAVDVHAIDYEFAVLAGTAEQTIAADC